MIKFYSICDRVMGERRVKHGVDRARDGVVGRVADGIVCWRDRGEGP
jgi:hypothetical protein